MTVAITFNSWQHNCMQTNSPSLCICVFSANVYSSTNTSAPTRKTTDCNGVICSWVIPFTEKKLCCVKPYSSQYIQSAFQVWLEIVLCAWTKSWGKLSAHSFGAGSVCVSASGFINHIGLYQRRRYLECVCTERNYIVSIFFFSSFE